MYVHEFATSRAIAYSDHLHTSRWAVEITKTTEKRSRLQQTVKSVLEQKSTEDAKTATRSLLSQRDWIKVVQSIDDYLPYLFGIYDCIKSDEVLLKGELVFAWRDTISSSSSSKVTLPGIQYELLSSLNLHAKALCNFAASLVASLGDFETAEAATLLDEDRKKKEDRLKFAADLQCRAAGIFAYVARHVIPEWEDLEGVSRLSQMGRSIESTAELAFALSELAHAEANLLAIRKLLSPCLCYQTAHHTPSPPLASNHPSPSLISKLYLHIAASYDSAMSLAQTASTKAGVRLESAPASSATDTGKTKSNRSISATLKQKMSGRSSHLEESAASGKVTSGFIKYLAKAARGSRARAYYWLGVDRGERGQYGEALAFLKMASDELDVSFSSKGLNIHKSEKSKEEKKESTRDKEDLLKLIAHFSASYKQLNDSVAFQPIPNSSLLTSQIPAGRSATTIKAYTMPPAAFGPGSVDDLSSSVQTMKGLGGEGEASGVHEYAGKDAYY